MLSELYIVNYAFCILYCDSLIYLQQFRDMKEITPLELKQKFDSKEDIQIIDVREEYEYEIANIGGELIPLASILEKSELISKDKTVVLHCKSGIRSASAIMNLENKFGFTNLYNLKGGILAYARDIDQSLSVY